jgi:hemolysin III
MHNGVNEFAINEEIWRAITHSIGLGLSIAGLVVLVVFSAMDSTALSVTSSAIFGAALIILYGSSTPLPCHHPYESEKDLSAT